jgi:2-polyprenyl-6-methoxyphenol hydroxylase-like FAD-dependent oxidoreductase
MKFFCYFIFCMSSPRRKRIVISGCGIAGLSLALGLSKSDLFEVFLFDKNSALATTKPIIIWKQGIKALINLNIKLDTIATPILKLSSTDSETAQVLVNWNTINHNDVESATLPSMYLLSLTSGWP